jgi:hypothetical protein
VRNHQSGMATLADVYQSKVKTTPHMSKETAIKIAVDLCVNQLTNAMNDRIKQSTNDTDDFDLEAPFVIKCKFPSESKKFKKALEKRLAKEKCYLHPGSIESDSITIYLAPYKKKFGDACMI